MGSGRSGEVSDVVEWVRSTRANRGENVEITREEWKEVCVHGIASFLLTTGTSLCILCSIDVIGIQMCEHTHTNTHNRFLMTKLYKVTFFLPSSTDEEDVSV